MSADQLAIYSTVLSGWMGNDNGTHDVNLAYQTRAFGLSGMDADCGAYLHLVPGPKDEVHRFQLSDLPQLRPSHVRLVDPRAGASEVAENDPGKHIGKGSSIKDAVENGFAHGLVTLGEIRFDADHTHAVVWYGFTCGRLCGNGATVILEKKYGAWAVKSHCSNWIS